MSQFIEIRIARRRHLPTGPGGGCVVCRDVIEPGQHYERFTVTPGDRSRSAGRWARMKAHHPYGDCIQPAHLRQEAAHG
ncbi:MULTISPECIES: hypothetical protein [unclassified Nonomuraea]|uniref:hypothetical protein n=1 Tax=unclassified Nonomuraea TaxID=2593643 RepID=UPI0033F5D10B